MHLEIVGSKLHHHTGATAEFIRKNFIKFDRQMKPVDFIIRVLFLPIPILGIRKSYPKRWLQLNGSNNLCFCMLLISLSLASNRVKILVACNQPYYHFLLEHLDDIDRTTTWDPQVELFPTPSLSSHGFPAILFPPKGGRRSWLYKVFLLIHNHITWVCLKKLIGVSTF